MQIPCIICFSLSLSHSLNYCQPLYICLIFTISICRYQHKTILWCLSFIEIDLHVNKKYIWFAKETCEWSICSVLYIHKRNYVREVGTRFEFFTERFVQSHVPRIEYCVPERTRWALSNGRFGFQNKIRYHRLQMKLWIFTMDKIFLKSISYVRHLSVF